MFATFPRSQLLSAPPFHVIKIIFRLRHFDTGRWSYLRGSAVGLGGVDDEVIDRIFMVQVTDVE